MIRNGYLESCCWFSSPSREQRTNSFPMMTMVLQYQNLPGHPIHPPADVTSRTEEGNPMAVSDSQTLERLRREESLAEQQGRHALNIAAILKNHPQYDAARQKAD